MYIHNKYDIYYFVHENIFVVDKNTISANMWSKMEKVGYKCLIFDLEFEMF
jgi:hypothetical protein